MGGMRFGDGPDRRKGTRKQRAAQEPHAHTVTIVLSAGQRACLDAAMAALRQHLADNKPDYVLWYEQDGEIGFERSGVSGAANSAGKRGALARKLRGKR